MRLTKPSTTVRVGNVEIRGIQNVLELEALELNSVSPTNGSVSVPPSALRGMEARTAIVVPCKDESLDRIRGIWSAIPASSLLISVSASADEAYDRELDALIDFCNSTGRNAMSIHQRDPHVADALRAAGMHYLLDDSENGDGLVYKGKGEGMVLGTALAATAIGFPTTITATTNPCAAHHNHPAASKAIGKCGLRGSLQPCICMDDGKRGTRRGDSTPGFYKYIGFIDADNFVPGSAHEYCKAFSAGLHLAESQDAMVRLSWNSKPKINNGKLEFKPSGRSSEIVNRWLNRLLREMDLAGGAKVVESPPVDEDDDLDEDDHYERIINDLIRTGNAGEHAMTMSLALKLRVASGYAIEPFHFLDIFENMADDTEKQDSKDAPSSTSIQSKTKTFTVPVRREHFLSVSPVSPASMSPRSSPCTSPTGGSPVLAAVDTAPTSPSAFSTNLATIPEEGPQLPPSVANAPRTPIKLTTNMQEVPVVQTSGNLSPAKVQILQIRTLNPHFHESRGETHVVRMWKQGLSCMYHWFPAVISKSLAQYRDDLRSAIFGGGSKTDVDNKSNDILPTPPVSNTASVAATPVTANSAINEAAVLAAAAWEPEKCRIYPAPGNFDLAKFRMHLDKAGGSFWWSGKERQQRMMRVAASMIENGEADLKTIDDLKKLKKQVDLNLLGIGPVIHEMRPKGDVDGFKADVDQV